MDQLKKLREKKEAVIAEMDALITASESGIMSDEAQKKFDGLKAEADLIQRNIGNMERVLDERAAAERSAMAATPPAAVAGNQPAVRPSRMTVPAEAKKWGTGTLKAFKGAEAAENAYKSGMWFSAAFGNEKAKQWCRDHGVAIESVHQGGVNTTGGWLVPEPLSAAIIELVLQYGSFRANSGVIPMTSDTLIIPRRSGGLTGYFVGEGDAITESTKAWNSVKLTTKDYAITTRISNQLLGDAIIPVMDNLAGEIAMSFAKNEDDCGFLGDGTSTYGGIVGLEQRFVSAVLSGTASTAVTAAMGMARYGTGYAPTNIDVATIVSLMSKLPTYARMNAKWYVSPAVYWGGIIKALSAAGGVTMTELIAGPGGQRLMGYPVVFCENINTGTAANRIVAYFGDLAMASKFGDRQSMSIASSDSASIGGYSVFERNEIALRGTERFDINVHDVGSSTAAGPIVAMIAHTS